MDLERVDFFMITAEDMRSSHDDDIFAIVTPSNTFVSLNAAGMVVDCEIGAVGATFLCVADATLQRRPALRPLDRAARMPASNVRLNDVVASRSQEQPQRLELAGTALLATADGGPEDASAPWDQEWQSYELVPFAAIARILAWNGAWVHHASRKLMKVESLERLYPFHSQSGWMNARGLIDFTQWPPGHGRPGQEAPQPGTSLSIVAHRETVSAYRPLLYYCVFGKYEYLEALALSLDSLDRNGHFNGTIAVITTFGEEAIRRHVPQRYQSSLIIVPMPYGSTALGRYGLDLEMVSAFQPIMYLDCDVVCTRPVEPMLVDIALADGICVATEWREYGKAASSPAEWEHVGHWFGKFLYAATGYTGPAARANAGIFGMPTAAIGKNVFSNILALMRHPDAVLAFTDQPFLNYLLHVMKIGNFTVLDDYIQVVRSAADVSIQHPHTLIHVLTALTKADKTSELRLALAQALLQHNYEHLSEGKGEAASAMTVTDERLSSMSA